MRRTTPREGKIGPLTSFRNRMGRPFDAEIRLNDDKLPGFDFGQPHEGEEAEAIDFSAQEPLGKCPKCGAAVYEHGNSYVAGKRAAPDPDKPLGPIPAMANRSP